MTVSQYIFSIWKGGNEIVLERKKKDYYDSVFFKRKKSKCLCMCGYIPVCKHKETWKYLH